MVLNKLSRSGVLDSAYRHVPGIVFPEQPGEPEAPVLKLHSLIGERTADMPDRVVSGSGLVAVRFFEHRVDVSDEASRGSKRLIPIWTSLPERVAAPVEVTLSFRGGSGTRDGGLTVFEQGVTAAYRVEKTGISSPVGPTVLLSITSSPGMYSAPVVLEGVRLIEHRNPADRYPSLQALARWGFGKAKRLIPET